MPQPAEINDSQGKSAKERCGFFFCPAIQLQLIDPNGEITGLHTKNTWPMSLFIKSMIALIIFRFFSDSTLKLCSDPVLGLC